MPRRRPRGSTSSRPGAPSSTARPTAASCSATSAATSIRAWPRGARLMFRYMPEMFKKDFADSEAEANRWVEEVIAGRKAEARRPPELLTRDVVARAIAQEVREGRGSPHGGAFLDIASRRRPEDIRKKLPSMYQQFHELADVDITRDPMEVGPTTHYMMGGVRVDAETQAATVPGLF